MKIHMFHCLFQIKKIQLINEIKKNIYIRKFVHVYIFKKMIIYFHE